MKTLRAIIPAMVLFLIAGCVTGYTLVATGVTAVDTLYVDADALCAFGIEPAQLPAQAKLVDVAGMANLMNQADHLLGF